MLIFTQFGGGPGDPANNVVRFLLAAFFWGVLILVSFRMWRSTNDRRHLYFSVSAAVGASRELFMFTAEYGSFRGYISFPIMFRYYPPLEHSIATLSIVLMGYAFLRFYFNFGKFSRLFLIGSSCLTVLTYLIIAPLWVRFLDTSLTGRPYVSVQFHDFPGDLIFRVVGAIITLFILAAFLYARGRSIRVPWLAFLAFFFFFLDDTLQVVNDLCNGRYAPVFAPIRHCFHIAGIVQLVGVYWWEVTRQLKNREQLLQAVLDAIPDHIFYKNTEGTYLGCNQTFAERFVGRSKGQIIGHTIHDLVSDPALAERFSRSDREIIATDTSHTYELPYTLPDGTQVVLETIKTPFRDTDGQIAGLIGVSRDITERRNLEEQLRHSQKMEAIGQLAGGVAHDFNNILTAIIGYASLMQFEIDPDDPQSANVDQILQSSERAAKLVQNLMAFSRRETLAASPYVLNTIVDNIRDFLQRIITEDIHFHLTCSESVLNVCVDSGQIEQALTNLVTNARDAMPKGGRLTITTQQYELNDSFVRNYGYGIPGSYALITVEDSGHGMDEETQKRIFEPFFTTKDVGKGTGLGLAIVYGIVKQHRGFITVSSEPGKGTAFRIYLPIVHMESEIDRKTAEAAPLEKGTETILVVEDEPTVRCVVETTLRKFNYTVISAEDGQDAVYKFVANSNKISLVLMDLVMPRMNGKDAADEIRRIDPDMKILFTSGYTADIIRSRGELDAGEEMILKPVNPQDLLRKMRQILNR
jgi:PAS domain S-box-containing protein